MAHLADGVGIDYTDRQVEEVGRMSHHGEVLDVEELTPGMLRVTLGGPGLDAFEPTPFTDQYVNALFVPDGAPYAVPFDVDEARRLAREHRPVGRRYTIRRWDEATRRDFANDPINLLAVDAGLHGYWAAGWLRPHIARSFNALLIDRQEIKVHQSPIDLMIRQMGDVYSLIVFPEGGRNTGTEMQEFKSGLYYLCKKRPDLEAVQVLSQLDGRRTLREGVRALLTELVQLMPNAYEMEEIHALTGAEGDNTVEIHARDDAPFAAIVFKTLAEPHVGDVSYFRILSGVVSNGQEVFNATRDITEKFGHLSVPLGKDRVEVQQLHAGDIGCIAKLRNTHTNDTLSTREHPVRLPQIDFPEPVVHFAIKAAARGEEEKVQAGIHRLHDEDPTLQVHYEPETHETIIAGMGERHLDVAMALLRRKYGVEAELRPSTGRGDEAPLVRLEVHADADAARLADGLAVRREVG